MKLTHFLLIIIGVLCGVLGWFVWSNNKSMGTGVLGPSYVFQGNTWQIQNVKWNQLEDGLKLRADLQLVRGGGTISFDEEVWRLHCGSVLTNPPKFDGETVKRKDISRLSMRVIVDGKSLLPVPIRIDVQDGSCSGKVLQDIEGAEGPMAGNYKKTEVDAFSKQLFGWRMADSKISRGTNGTQLKVFFERVGNNEEALESFPFEAGCALVLMGTPERLSTPIGEIEVAKVDGVEIHAVSSVGTSKLSFRKSAKELFVLDERRCVRGSDD